MLCSRPPKPLQRGENFYSAAAGRAFAFGKVSKSEATAGFRMFLPVDDQGRPITAPVLTDEEAARLDALKRERVEALTQFAAATYGKACGAGGVKGTEGVDHPMVRAYLRGRGIDPAWLPGGQVPPVIRYMSHAPGWPRFDEARREVQTAGRGRPAMISLVLRCGDEDDYAEGDRHAVRGLHITYLEGTPETGVRKASDVEASKAWCGPCDGVVRFGATFDAVPEGVLLWGEGKETSLAAMAGTGWTAWAALSSTKLVSIKLPSWTWALDAEGVPKIHTIVILEDLDKVLDRRGRVSKTGQRRSAAAAAALLEAYPWLTVTIRGPRADVAPELVRLATDQDAGCVAGEHRPIADDQGVDWDDVIKLEDGRDRVSRGIRGGVDVETARRNAADWWSRHGEAWLAARARGETRSPAEAAAAAAESVASAPPAAANANQVGGGEQDDQAGGVAELEGLGDVRFENVPDREVGLWCEVKHGDKWVPAISARGIDKARLFLLRECLPAGSRRFGLVLWAGKWYRYTGGGYRQLPPHLLFRWIANWLERWKTYRLTRDGIEVMRCNPTRNMVAEVVEQLGSIVYVEAEHVPAFLPESLDHEGNVLWAGDHEASQYVEGLGDAREYISDRDGLIWLGQLTRIAKSIEADPLNPRVEKIQRVKHNPLLFVTTTRDYAIPLDVLQRAIEAQRWTDADWQHAGAEHFPRWLKDATANDPAEDKAARVRQLGQQFADIITPDRYWAEIMHVFPGPKRGGKGVLATAIRAASGRNACWPGKLRNLTSDMGMTAFLGHQAVIFEDLHMGVFVDSPEVVEGMKSGSGNDPIQYRGLYQDFGQAWPTWRFIMFFNETPTKLKDESGALAGRFIVWPLRVSFFGKTDARVKQGVAGEGGAVAAWALFHYAFMMAQPRPAIQVSQLGRESQERIEQATAHIPIFLKDVCELDDVDGQQALMVNDERRCTNAELREAYALWCEKEGRDPLTPAKLFAPIDSIVAGVRVCEWRDERDGKTTKVRGFRGFALNGVAVANLKADVLAARRRNALKGDEPAGVVHYDEPGRDPFPR